MHKKVYEYIQNEVTGYKTLVYKSESAYCFITIDRDGTNYFLVDLEFDCFYPVSSCVTRGGLAPSEDYDAAVSLLFELDLARLGFGKCYPWHKTSLEEMERDITNGVYVKVFSSCPKFDPWKWFRPKNRQ